MYFCIVDPKKSKKVNKKMRCEPLKSKNILFEDVMTIFIWVRKVGAEIGFTIVFLSKQKSKKVYQKMGY